MSAKCQKRTSCRKGRLYDPALVFRFWRGRKAHEMRSDAKPPAVPPLVNVRVTSIGWFTVELRIPVTGMYNGDVVQNPHHDIHRLGMRARIRIGDPLEKPFAVQQGAIRGGDVEVFRKKSKLRAVRIGVGCTLVR
jgi:hypothetical protein